MSIITLCKYVCVCSFILICTHCFQFLTPSVGLAMFALAFSADKMRHTLCEDNIRYNMHAKKVFNDWNML